MRLTITQPHRKLIMLCSTYLTSQILLTVSNVSEYTVIEDNTQDHHKFLDDNLEYVTGNIIIPMNKIDMIVVEKDSKYGYI